MNSITWRLIPILAVIVSMQVGCSRSGNPPNSAKPPDTTEGPRITSVSVVKAEPQSVEIAAGTSGKARVRLNIQNGFHVNANPPTYSYLKATELQFPAKDGISVTSVAYPDPIKRKLDFEKEPLAVYEGETFLIVAFKADPSTTKGDRHLSGKLRIQACDDQVCYPPGEMDVAIPVKVK
jgi:thioredoxin:protein disulfide reductase